MTESMDEQAVWRRVSAAADSGAAPARAPGQDFTDLIAETRQTSRLSLRLQTGASGSGRQTLQQASRTLSRQEQTLTGLSRLLGLPVPPARRESGPGHPALRTLLEALRHLSDNLEARSKVSPAPASRVLSALAEEDRALFLQLLPLL